MANDHLNILFKKALTAHMETRLEEAAGLYRKLISKAPGHVPALNNLGTICLQTDDLNNAAIYFEKAIKIDNLNADALSNLGLIYKEKGDLEKATRFFQKALAINPSDSDLHTNLGAVLKIGGDFEQAKRCHQKALSLDPKNVKALNNLGLVYKEMANWQKAVHALKQALALNPDDEELFFNLSEVMASCGMLAEAVALVQKACALFPDSLTTAIGAARVMIECGHWENADPLIKAIIQYPFSQNEISLLRHLLLFINAAALSADDVAKIHSTCGKLIEQKIFQNPQYTPFNFKTRFKKKAKIRIGYVSPDFKRHSVGYFFHEIIRHHDHERFEIYCYAISAKKDDLTRKIAGQATLFCNASGLTDFDLARRIHNDRIQILVDLAGYTRDNRIDLFALKPAPVQVTAIGYPHGSGLPQMDFRITDARAEGPGADAHYCEKLVRLDGFFLPLPDFKECEKPPLRTELGLSRQAFVLASFNAWHKLRPEVLRLWNRILNKIDNAHILFSFKHAEKPYAQNRIRSYFDVDPKRLLFLSQTATEKQHRSRYLIADAALDPFPYNGTTTSLEALLMGVPVVTLKGPQHVQRTTYSMLAHLGLNMLVAENENSYVSIICDLAQQPEYLNDIRARLAQAVKRITARGNKGYVHQLEDAFEAMWAAYLEPAPNSVCGQENMHLQTGSNQPKL